MKSLVFQYGTEKIQNGGIIDIYSIDDLLKKNQTIFIIFNVYVKYQNHSRVSAF